MPKVDAKVFAAKPAQGTIEAALALAPDRAAVRAQKHAEIGRPADFTDGAGNTIKIDSIAANGRMLTVTARVLAPGGADITPPSLNPMLFVNPPCKAWNGTYSTQTIEGMTSDVQNFKEDVAAALRQIVLDTIGHARK